MGNIKTNKVFGARGIGVVNSNLNSSFQGTPNTLSNGVFFNSDVSTKWADRDYWDSMGLKVLVKTCYKIDKDGLPIPMTLEEVVNEKLDNKKSVLEQMVNDFVDTACFGGVMAIKNKNVNLTGTIQYNIGCNKLLNRTEIKTHDILSPYRNPKAEKKSGEDGEISRTTIGKSTFIERALYVQGFTVCPEQANSMVDLVKSKDFKGFKEEHYLAFKKATLCSITRLNSRSKVGARDEFAIFISLKEGSDYVLPNIAELIDAELDDEEVMTIVNFDRLAFVNDLKDVESVEIYYNGAVCDIKHKFNNPYVWDTTSGFKLREEA